MDFIKFIIYYYGLQLLAVIILVILGYLIWDKRYKKPKTSIPPGYEKTNEVNIDPTTGIKTRTYYNKDTGDRIYIEEK